MERCIHRSIFINILFVLFDYNLSFKEYVDMNTKRIFLLLAIVCIFNMVQGDEQYDVRNTRWGMTPDEVIKAESNNFFINYTFSETPSGHTILSASLENIEGFNSLLSYIFKDNHLVSASCWFFPIKGAYFEVSKSFFSNDYKVIQEYLEKQYGKPDKVIGEDKCLWNKDKTVIIHLIREQYGSAFHGIIFYDADVWKNMGENSVFLNQ